ncbi:hypothetical protein ACIOEW_31870 [Streptomyces sp. NPDC087901]|uniref:hypothetical protein n=1 Tax=unclassified Streptomyces TaxID=2593676 RepID=UPI003425FD3A
MSEQIADERARAGSPVVQVAGRAVRLVPDRGPGAESAMSADYQRILTDARQAAGPVATRQIGEALGLDTGVRGKLESLRGKLTKPASRPPAPSSSPPPRRKPVGLAAAHAPVEHAFTHLKNWRILTKPRTDPARATHLLRALLVLAKLETAAAE